MSIIESVSNQDLWTVNLTEDDPINKNFKQLLSRGKEKINPRRILKSEEKINPRTGKILKSEVETEKINPRTGKILKSEVETPSRILRRNPIREQSPRRNRSEEFFLSLGEVEPVTPSSKVIPSQKRLKK